MANLREIRIGHYSFLPCLQRKPRCTCREPQPPIVVWGHFCNDFYCFTVSIELAAWDSWARMDVVVSDFLVLLTLPCSACLPVCPFSTQSSNGSQSVSQPVRNPATNQIEGLHQCLLSSPLIALAGGDLWLLLLPSPCNLSSSTQEKGELMKKGWEKPLQEITERQLIGALDKEG